MRCASQTKRHLIGAQAKADGSKALQVQVAQSIYLQWQEISFQRRENRANQPALENAATNQGADLGGMAILLAGMRDRLNQMLHLQLQMTNS